MIKGMHISLKQHYPKFKPQSKSAEKPGPNLLTEAWQVE